jgi:hypothetical protein
MGCIANATLSTKQCYLLFFFLAYGFSRKIKQITGSFARDTIEAPAYVWQIVGKAIDRDKVSRSTLLGSLRCFLALFLGSCHVALQAGKPAPPNPQSLPQPGVILQTHSAPHLCKSTIICSAAVSAMSVSDSDSL